MNWKTPAMWTGGECWIMGGGYSMPKQFKIPENITQCVCVGKQLPSAYSPFLEVLHDKHVIGINNAYLIGTWMDALFFGDGSWYLTHRKNLAKWPGLKVTCTPKFANRKKEKMEGVKYLGKDHQRTHGISENVSKVSWNGNSGSAAISLAAHFGVKRIFLLGFDMEASKFTHWHGSHNKNYKKGGRGKKQPYQRHLRGFPQIARDAKTRGIEIFNVNPVSKIDSFPKITLKEALNA